MDGEYEEKIELQPDEEAEDISKWMKCWTRRFMRYSNFICSKPTPRVVSTMRRSKKNCGENPRRRRRGDTRTTITIASATTSPACLGNPWFICTLWLADYYITRAQKPAELKMALPIFEWPANHALESGVLASR